MKTALLCLVLTGLSGCSKPAQRFVPMPRGDNDPPLVLDTKTGQFCKGSPRQSSIFPLCYDLYKGKE